MEQDMSRGNPTRLILLFLLPIIGGSLFQQFYSMVDTIIVGRFIGVKALAAVGSTGGVSFFVLGFVIGLTAGFSVIISQKFGAKDLDSMRKAISMSILTASVVSIVVSTLAVLLCRPLLLVMNTPYDIIDDATSYLRIIFIGIIATIYYNLLASILRALGDSKSPLFFLLIASVLNIIGDLIAVLILDMGVQGVALATVLSQSISALLCIFYISRRYPSLHLSKSDWSLDWPMIGNLLRIGVPSALHFSVCALGVMFVQAFINKMGSDTVAAFSVGIKIEQLVTLPLSTLGVAMTTFAGQNLGAGRLDRVKQGVRSATLLLVLFSAAAFFLLLAFGEDLARLFIDAKNIAVIEKVQLYLNVTSPFYIPLGLIFVLRSTSQGMGSGLIPLLSSLQEMAFRILVALTLPKYLGYVGICLASPIAWVAAATLLFFAYRIQIKRLSLILYMKQ
ncbi:MAG TPA: MATE family efflux transporter [Spirochaetales bacterium]|nr:MATE family efflux transporter [Spirochaetales bacterium]